MNLLRRARLRLSLLKYELLSREAATLAAWLAVIAVLETTAPYIHSDRLDALALATLGVGLVATIKLHAAAPLRWISPLERTLAEAARALSLLDLAAGVDLRRQPALRPGTPKVVRVLALCSAALFAGAALGGRRWPDALRDIAAVSYTLYLVTLGLLWVALIAGTALCGGLTLAALRDSLIEARVRSRRLAQAIRFHERLESSLMLAVIGLTLVASLLLSPAVGAALALLTVGATCALPALSGLELDFIWREGHGEARGASFVHSLLGALLPLAAILAAPILMALGDEVLSPFGRDTSDTMLITRALGRLLLWSAVPALATLLFQVARLTRSWRAFDRMRRGPHEVIVRGLTSREPRRELAASCARRGFRVRFGGSPRAEALEVCAVEGDASPGLDPFGPSWPRVVSAGWLGSEEGLRGLQRRWERVQRRHLARALRTLFKSHAARDFERGSGTFVAPHLWFAGGLERDVQEEAFQHPDEYLLERHAGQAYADVLPWSARGYLFEVLRDLELDLIFVEDGVGFRKLQRVLDALFELHDIHGGSQRAEERHLTGLPGLSVVIVDVGVSEQPDWSVHPEPEYEEVGRARVLHVFRERGGGSPDAPVPEQRSWTPISEWGPLLPSA